MENEEPTLPKIDSEDEKQESEEGKKDSKKNLSQTIKKKLMELEEREKKLKEREILWGAIAMNAESPIRIYKKEEDNLRGLSKVDKILTLLEELKSSIIFKNHIEEIAEFKEIVAERKLNNLSKRIVRNFGDYDISVANARESQTKINLMLKYLVLLMAGCDKSKLSGFEMNCFYKARGLLKAFHFRLNIIDIHFSSKKHKPIELLRIFSALEPTITALSALDYDDTVAEEYDKVIKSFGTFIKEEREDFMRSQFKDEYIEIVDQKTQMHTFIRLLNRFNLNAAQIMEQLTKWEKISPDQRKKFLEFLAVELTPTEKHIVAKSEIDEMRSKGLM